MNAELPKPDYARNMRILGHCDQGGRPDGVQIMVHRGFAYVGHGYSNGSLVGSYGVGFSGDAVFRNPGAIPGYAGQLEQTRGFNFAAGAQHLLSPSTRPAGGARRWVPQPAP